MPRLVPIYGDRARNPVHGIGTVISAHFGWDGYCVTVEFEGVPRAGTAVGPASIWRTYRVGQCVWQRKTHEWLVRSGQRRIVNASQTEGT